MAKEMAEKFYIADEALGGNEREYVKSDKNAEVGDYIVVTKMEDSYSCYDVGHVGEVVSICNDGDLRVNFAGYGNSFVNGGGSWFVGEHSESEYDTLTPSGNVRIDGERIFRMVDRKAEVGDKVIYYYEDKSDGIVSTVTDVGVSSVDIEPYAETDVSYVSGYNHGAYRVLESVEPSEATEESPQDNRDVTDLIANLAQEVVKLRKQVKALSERVDSNRDDTVTFAEEFTAFKKEQEFANELFESDIVLLDERTQPEELAETVLGNITIRRSGRGRGVYGGSN